MFKNLIMMFISVVSFFFKNITYSGPCLVAATLYACPVNTLMNIGRLI